MGMRVAIQGERGAYSECAALDFFPGAEAVYCRHYPDVFAAVDKGDADCMVIPIENSTAGSIYQYYDLMLEYASKRGFRVYGERKLLIRHNLVGLPSARLSQIVEVRSHYQALDQCQDSILRMKKKPVQEYDTAGAARIIKAENLMHVAAISSRQAAKVLGLKVLARNIQDREDNYTRFLWVQKKPAPQLTARKVKTSVAFCIPNQPGSLFRALAAFGSRQGVGIVRIESRNLIGTSSWSRFARRHKKGDDEGVWDLVYYLDFISPPGKVDSVLDHLRELVLRKKGEALQVFGTYPEGERRDITGELWLR